MKNTDTLPVSGFLVNVRLAIGEEHHFLSVQVPVQGLLEAPRVPRSAFAVALPFGDNAIDELTHVSEDRLELGAR